MNASIIIPTYQRTTLLRDVVRSIELQDYPQDRFEVLIVDNGPEPSSQLQDFCRSGSIRSIRYIHEPRNGLLHARHAGAANAAGDVLVYIDDDVICPEGWLSALLASFADERVAAVGGRVVLRYEAACPEWVKGFGSALSALDLGSKGLFLNLGSSAYGCNMAVRRAALYDVGGFNPDYYGDPALRTYIGDGECGLVRKLQKAGKLVWYAPEAWLHHRVPPSRMTLRYHEQRARIMGIERIYSSYRYEKRAPVRLLRRAAGYGLRWLCHSFLCAFAASGSPHWYRHRLSAAGYSESVLQTVRLLRSRSLRQHVTAPSYL